MHPSGYRPFGYEPDPETGLLVVKEDEAPLVPIIFDLYANKRLGSRAVAQWLNRRGHRTKASRPWGHTAVLTVLTNRAYVGEIFFRGRYHPAPHPRLVEAKVFQTAQAILESRGEDMALRRTNGSDYLLTGLIVCGKCGKRFIGASAKGNAYRYAYYVCFSRHRLTYSRRLRTFSSSSPSFFSPVRGGTCSASVKGSPRLSRRYGTCRPPESTIRMSPSSV